MPEPVLFTHIPPEQRPWSDDDTDPALHVKTPQIFDDQATMVGMPAVLAVSRAEPYRVDKRQERVIVVIVVLTMIVTFVVLGVFIITSLVKMAPTSPRHVMVPASSVPSKVSN